MERKEWERVQKEGVNSVSHINRCIKTVGKTRTWL